MSTVAEIRQELRLPAQPSHLGTAREFADDVARSWGFDEEGRYQFAFAANEAVTNAIEHGLPCEDGTIRLRVAEEREALSLYVHDCGSFAPRPSQPRGLGERGRGLALMAMMMDEVELKPDTAGTVLRLSKRRTPGAAAA
jgi:anti-sigma regulatory factor (Ser/Thr protein kinase)